MPSLGIDIGGTSVRVGAFESLDSTEPFDSYSFDAAQDYERDFELLRQTCANLRSRSGPVEGIGVAIAGVINKERTLLAKAGNTASWVNRPFVDALGIAFDCAVALGNDAEAAALAEALYGNPQGWDFWSLIWGTGVGGTLVRHIDGKPYPFAGEMGHQMVRARLGNQCACGQMDCLEVYCGGAGIKKYRNVASAADLSEAQWGRVLDCMADGLHNLVTIQPVPYIYFSGGIAAKQSHRLEVLQQMLEEELCIVEAPQVRLSRFGEGAGTVGALALLKAGLA